MPPLLSYIIGKHYVLILSTQHLNRVITDFKDGEVDVLTLVTDEGPWRIFADGSTHGDKPEHVSVSCHTWTSLESPTKPDLPSSIPPKV